MTLPKTNTATESAHYESSTKENTMDNITVCSFEQPKVILYAHETGKESHDSKNTCLNLTKPTPPKQIKNQAFENSKLSGESKFKTISKASNSSTAKHLIKRPVPVRLQTRDHLSASTENLHILTRRARVSSQTGQVSRSLPGSPTMSPRLLRRNRDSTTLFQTKTNPTVCLPLVTKPNQNFPANNFPISGHIDRTTAEETLLDQEIQVLNLNSPAKSNRFEDEFLLKFALRRVQSLEHKERLGSTISSGQKNDQSNSYQNGIYDRFQSLPNSPPQTPIFDGAMLQPSKKYLVNRRRTVAYGGGESRIPYHEWLEGKTQDFRRKSLNLQYEKEIERMRDMQSRQQRFEKAKTFDEWREDKEEHLKRRTKETKEKLQEKEELEIEKQKQNEELRAKKYNEWLVKKFEKELAAEERKIQELRNVKAKQEKVSVRKLKSK